MKNKDRIFAAGELILIVLSGAAAFGFGAIFDVVESFFTTDKGLYTNLNPFLSKNGCSMAISTFYKTIEELEKRHLITRLRGKWVITEKGQEMISLKIPEKMRGAWNGKWQIVTFDIIEKDRKKRNIVRNHLKALGCGMMQLSVWVSAYDIEKHLQELQAAYNLGNNLRWFTCASVDNEKDLIYRCWPLKEIGNKYQTLIDASRKLPLNRKLENLLEFKKWEKEYLKILEEDPMLPPTLLPENWPGTEIAKKHLILRKIFS